MIDEIRQKFQRQEYEYSLHAVDQSILKRITRREVEEAVASGQIIEDLSDRQVRSKLPHLWDDGYWQTASCPVHLSDPTESQAYHCL
jgi:hypothetical protein